MTEKQMLKKLPLLEKPISVRLKFRKIGSLQYISHLDLQRTFTRVIVRSSVPVWYTQGFNPHIKMVFSTPLSVGSESVCEYLDIKIERDISLTELVERLNRELTDELYITEAYFPSTDFSDIAYAEYEIKISTSGATEKLAGDIRALLTTSPLYMTKRTKAGEREIDIVPLVNSISSEFDCESGIIKINAVLCASSTEFLNPELLVSALKQNLGILLGDPTREWYTVLRTDVLKNDLTRFR